MAHRFKFARIGGIDNILHNPKTLNPITHEVVINEWEKDYIKMKKDMIYDDIKPSFNDLIDNLKQLRLKLQNLDWQFYLIFAS